MTACKGQPTGVSGDACQGDRPTDKPAARSLLCFKSV